MVKSAPDRRSQGVCYDSVSVAMLSSGTDTVDVNILHGLIFTTLPIIPRVFGI